MTETAAAEATMLGLASHLVNRVGRGRARRLTRLAGGNNNQVYRIETEAGEALVLKHYYSDPRDPRDRLAAEWSFLQQSWSRGVRTIPEPLACEPSAHAALYGFVPGRKLLAAELNPEHIDAAVDFILAVNAPPVPQVLAPASEACFSLAGHIATVERRVVGLMRIDADLPHNADALRFIVGRLTPAWRAVQAELTTGAGAAGLTMDARLAGRDCCLSPSDFGFHNALANDNGGLTFLDFEYAGRDDPAKLVCDFFCQPEIPVPIGYHAGFVARLAQGLGLDEAAQARCRVLLDLYRIKWACIMLNDFLPLGNARRAFADQTSRAARCVRQLAMAEAQIGAIGA